jgi:catechol 2,3-dioxygenase-like lactoylglutathione lyase family enzyme
VIAVAVELNHTIVASSDKHASAEFVARILGLGPPKVFGHFVAVEVDNKVSLDFDNASDVRSQHYAFLVSDEEFDPIFDRVRGEGVQFYADPGHQRAGEINTRDGGRGFYFSGPDGHNLEVLTRPYGSGS